MNQHLVPGAAGTDVFVLEHGSGTPVLLLAGLGDKHDAWGFQFETLGSERRLLALDNRGTGRSALPDEGVTMPGMADDAAAVLQALDATPAHVMGFSGGGAVAQELVLRHPDLARSLVLVGTWSRPDPHLRALTATWSALLDHAPDEVFLDVLLRWVYTDAAHEDGRVAAWKAEAMADPLGADAALVKAQLEAFDTHDTAARLRSLELPALVVAGDRDPIFPRPVADELAAAIPGARLEILAGQSHQPFQEVPEDFDRLVSGFWDEVEAG